MALPSAEPVGNLGPPTPGDLYVFPLGADAALEWLVVRAHPDDHNLLFLVPADGSPLAGTPDVPLPHDLVRRPLTVRCGEGLWAPALHLQPGFRVGVLPAEALRLVRQKVGDLARGRVTGTEEQRRADGDPEYEDWLGRVERARERLQAEMDHAPRR
jgi:hypothetical protein